VIISRLPLCKTSNCNRAFIPLSLIGNMRFVVMSIVENIN